MKTKILKSNIDWDFAKNVSRTTVNKNHTLSPASDKFILNLLVSEHSPIRESTLRWQWPSIKSWIATHFSRHRWSCYISTQRSDRTGISRDELTQSELVKMDCSANSQELIDTSRKRLCHLASEETRLYWEDLKLRVYDSGEEELFMVMVPNCVYRAGCPEFKKCGYYQKLTDIDSRVASTNIKVRYMAYNAIFLGGKDEE